MPPTPPSRPSTTSARPLLCALNELPTREASSSLTRYPTLCRWPAYDGPGFPRPTTNQSGSVIGPSLNSRPFLVRCSSRCSRVTTRLTAERSLLPGSGLVAGGLALGAGLALDGLLRLFTLDARVGLGASELGVDLLRGRSVGDVDDQRVVVGEHRAAARKGQVLGQDLVTDLSPLDGDLDELG